ncbi:hypothetical protein ACJX0J_026514, partial [Zea mays]
KSGIALKIMGGGGGGKQRHISIFFSHPDIIIFSQQVGQGGELLREKLALQLYSFGSTVVKYYGHVIIWTNLYFSIQVYILMFSLLTINFGLEIFMDLSNIFILFTSGAAH